MRGLRHVGWLGCLGLYLGTVVMAAPISRHRVRPRATVDDAHFSRHALMLPDGATLAYYVRPGAGPTLVLVPETHGDRTQFYEPEFLQQLPPEHRIVIVESRGQGRSWPPPTAAAASIEGYASDVLAVVTQLALPAWYVGGHSLGGMIALEIAGRRPPGLRGVIALEGWVHARVQREAFPEPAPPTEAERAEARRQREERYRSQRWSDEEYARLGRIWTAWQGGEAIVRALRYPLLSVWGDRGRPIRPDRARLLLPEVPHIDVHWIAGADHYVTDAPYAGEVGRTIKGFMQRVEATHANVRPEHQIVFREPGRFGGWPANNGSWVWEDEVLVGFTAGWHQVQDARRHQIDRSRPPEAAFARSTDGGRSWRIERPPSLRTAEASVGALRPLEQPLDFRHPGFALTLRYQAETSYFYYSYDRGRTWRGPHPVPTFGAPGVQARTDYLVQGSREASVLLTALKSNRREGRPLCARTTDGGLTWRLEAYIGPEPAGFAIMPSTVALPKGDWLTAVRVSDPSGTWIQAWRSPDRGITWIDAGRPAPDTGAFSGNPPHLLRLRDGRLCLTYGFRAPPFGVRARLSRDDGETWEPEIVLRSDAVAHDLGYPRSFERKDGRIVTVYYCNDGQHSERFIAATTWSPVSLLAP